MPRRKNSLSGMPQSERSLIWSLASGFPSFLSAKTDGVRAIAEVFTVNGRRVGLAMVSQGMAWHFLKYAPADLRLADAEKAARAGKRGLWSDAAPVAPWEWRKH